jgi:hypothetical protein
MNSRRKLKRRAVREEVFELGSREESSGIQERKCRRQRWHNSRGGSILKEEENPPRDSERRKQSSTMPFSTIRSD